MKDDVSKKIQVEVKLKAFVNGRRVYPGQKVLISEKDFNSDVFKSLETKEAKEGEVKEKKEVEKAPGAAETKKISKEVI